MKDNIQDVETAIRLSKAVIRNIKQNLFWAFFYNTLGIPIAAGVLHLFGGPLLSPVFAGAAMAFSSVSVVSNALRFVTLHELIQNAFIIRMTICSAMNAVSAVKLSAAIKKDIAV